MDEPLRDLVSQQPIAHRVLISRCENALRSQRPDMFTSLNPYVTRCHYVDGMVGSPIGNVDRVVQLTIETFGDCDNVHITDISVDELKRLIVSVIHTL